MTHNVCHGYQTDEELKALQNSAGLSVFCCPIQILNELQIAIPFQGTQLLFALSHPVRWQPDKQREIAERYDVKQQAVNEWMRTGELDLYFVLNQDKLPKSEHG